jgi:uncharacterized protein (DUF305 family)
VIQVPRRLFKGLMAVAALALMLVPATEAKGPAGAFDRQYLTDMIGHHTMGVEMGEMAVDKATHPELKQAAESIIRSQTAEIKRMRSWLRRWYGKQHVAPEHGHEDMAAMEELEDATGAEFEIRFLALMSVHHTQAVERSEVALDRARHPQVRKLARAIIKAQNSEIEQFRNWLVEWYAG